LKSVAITVIGSNLVDKVVSCLIGWMLVKRLPERIRSLFPLADEAV